MTVAMRMRADANLTADDRRYAVRINVHIDAELLDKRRHCFAVTLINLSITGCRFESEIPISVAAPVTLMIEGIAPILGEIAWTEGKLVGCHFRETLSLSICNSIIRSLRKRSSRL